MPRSARDVIVDRAVFLHLFDVGSGFSDEMEIQHSLSLGRTNNCLIVAVCLQ
jgi:hypothetical protein